MQPTINDGEVLLVDLDESVRIPEKVINGRVYIIKWGVTGEEISVKRLHFDWAARTIIVKSDNPLWDKMSIVLGQDEKLQDLVLGRVIWVGKENI